MTSKQRFLRLASWAGLILGIGLAYALFVRLTGLAIPCPIRLVTGLLCPGCGVTGMCLALLGLDFPGAWRANPGLLLLLPLLCVLLGQVAWGYVKTGGTRPTKAQNVFIWLMVAYMLGYALLRNLL